MMLKKPQTPLNSLEQIYYKSHRTQWVSTSTSSHPSTDTQRYDIFTLDGAAADQEPHFGGQILEMAQLAKVQSLVTTMSENVTIHFLTSPVEISSKIWEDTSFWDSDYCVEPCGNRNRCKYGFTWVVKKQIDKQSDAENTLVEDDTEIELETRAVCDWHVYYTTRTECRRRCRFTYGHLFWKLPEASYLALLVLEWLASECYTIGTVSRSGSIASQEAWLENVIVGWQGRVWRRSYFPARQTLQKTEIVGSIRLLLFVDCCVWSRIGQTARRSTPERSRARVYSDSSQRCRMRRGRRQDRRESRETRNPGVIWCVGGMIFRETHRIARTSWANACALDEMCEMWRATRKMCACVRTVRCYLYTSRRVHDMCQCLDAKSVPKPRKLQSWWMCKTAKKFENSGQLGQQLKQCSSAISFLMLVCTWINCGLRLPFLPPLLVLPPFWFPLSPLLRIFLCWEFHHVEFCDHDEEEDEVGVEKYVFQFWLTIPNSVEW